MVQRHHVKTGVGFRQFHRFHGGHGTCNEVVSCDRNQLLVTTGTTGKKDNGDVVPGIWGEVNGTRSTLCRNHPECQILQLLDAKHRPNTVVQLQLANISVQRHNSISLHLLDIHVQLFWYRVRCHRHNRVFVRKSDNSDCHKRAIRQDDSDTGLAMAGRPNRQLKVLHELPDGTMCQVSSSADIDETGAGVCPDQFCDVGDGCFDLCAEADDGFIVFDFERFGKGFVDVLEASKELTDGPGTGVRGEESGEMVSGIWVRGLTAEAK